MNWTTDYNCPVCHESATQQMPRIGDFDEVNCPNCGRYRINGSALAMAKDRGAAERQQALEKAQRAVDKPGEIPVIGSREFQ